MPSERGTGPGFGPGPGDPTVAAALLAPAARSAERLALYGGSFDPPHAGHLHVAEAAREAFGLDHVLFVPARRPPHKPGRQLAPGADRVALLRLLLAERRWARDGASVWTGELLRRGPSYTLHTVHRLREQRDEANAPLFLILGSDNLNGFDRWHGVEELVSLVQPIVIFRTGTALDATIAPDLSPEARERLTAGFLEVPPLDVSSSELRERLAEGRDPGPQLPAALREYVRARGIYGSR